MAVPFQGYHLQVRPANAFTKAPGLAAALSLDAAIETTTTVKIPIILLKLVSKVQGIVAAIKILLAIKMNCLFKNADLTS